jgi:hypothetical protein
MMLVAEKYLELLKDSKIKGFLFEQQNYIHEDQLKKQ